MDKKNIYLAPRAELYAIQGLTAILTGSTEVGTSPFVDEDVAYTL